MSTFDLGNLTESQNYLGAVDSNNPFDIYKFNLSGTGSFQLTLGGLSNNADLELLNSKGEVLSISNASGTNSEEISIDNFIIGADYFARVVQVSGVTKYSLDLDFVEKAKEFNPNSQVDPLTGLQIESGYFTVGSTVKVGVDFVFDGGWYKGELAVFSLEGLDKFEPGTAEFIKEAAKRSLSNSPQGYVVISDATEDAKASGGLGDGNYNDSKYLGIKTFDMKPGDKFGFMLVPNGTVQQVFNDPNIGGAIRPLFSLVTANPNQAFHTGQIADFNGAGSVFVMEDRRVDTGSDKDYNDIIFKVTGATGLAVNLDEVINPAKDWRGSEQGKKFIDSLQPESSIDPKPPVDPTPVDPKPPIDPTPIDPTPPVDPKPPIDSTPIDQTPPVDPKPPVDPTPVDPKPPIDPTPIDPTPVDPQPPVDPTLPVDPTPPIDPTPLIDRNQPLIGIIDTGFSGNNPDIDYRRVVLGSDRISNDNNPLLSPGEGNEHGTHILGLIAAIQGNGIGIDGINDKAQIWLGRAVGSGGWADSLIEFVDAARASRQRNAVVNLSIDLTQVNPDGSVTTRYELTPKERQAIEYARQNHVLIVTAAGNDGGVMSVLGQASQEFDNIITVGASNEFDRANYSSYGAGLDILTEGGTRDNPVLSTVKDGVGMMTGTSVAAARATGVASLVWVANPDLSYRQVIDILELTAVDVKTPGWDAETGAGLLNAVAAIELAKKTTPQDYTPFSWVAPFTWDGEGKVTPSDRAASGGNTLATAAVQPDPNFSDSDTVDVNNREKYYEVTIEQPGYLRYTVTRTNGTEWLPSVEWLRTDGKPVSRQFSFAPTGISGGAAGGGGDANSTSMTRGIFVDPGTYYLKTSLVDSYQSPEFWLDPPVQYTTVQNYDLSSAFIPDLPATFSGAAQFKTPDGQRVAELNISSQVNYDPANPDSAKVQYWLDVSEPGNLTLKIGSSADKIGLLAKKIIGQGDANSDGQILFASGAIRPDQAQSLQLLNLNKGRYLLEVYPRRGSNSQPFIQPFTINGVFSRQAPNPGEGQVPSNAGTFAKTVTSNGVDTHYYANGYLSVQPSGYATWYTYGAGVPLPTISGATQPGASVPPFSTLGLGTATLVTNVPPDYAGNSFNQARNIGILNSTQTFQDFLGDADPSDYYRFELNNDSNLYWRVDGLNPGVDFQLYKATNNGIELQWSTNTPAPNFSSDMAGTYPGTPGTYYIRLKPFASGGSNYNFSLSAIPRNTAPESLQFNLTSNSYNVGASVELNGKVFDRNGANDISRVDFWLKQNGNDWQFFSRNQSLTRDAQWANFSLSVDELATGNYELKATAYDQSGATSNTFSGAFQVTAPFDINASRSFSNGKTLSGDMLAEYNRLVSQGNYLGDPSFVETSDRITYFGTPVRRSFFQQPGQTRGYYSIYQSKDGTFSLGGAIADYYTNTYFNSPNDLNGLFAVDSGLGVPTSSAIRQADGSEVAYFEGGFLTNRYGVVTPTYYLKDRFDLVGQGAPNGTELQWKNDYGYWNPSTVGQPTGSVRRINNGWIQEFKTNPSGDVDNIFLLKDGQSALGGLEKYIDNNGQQQQITTGGPYRVQGGILNAYRSLGGQDGVLGFPTMSQLRSNYNGYKAYQAFENGFIAETYEGRTIKRNWQGQDIWPNISANHWNARFINRNQGNVADYNSYDFTNPAAVVDLGEQKQGNGLIGLHKDFGEGSPANGVQNDYFAMLAWTRTYLEAGKTYKITTQSDDGTWFMLKKAETNNWITNLPQGNDEDDGGDWRDRSATEPAKTVQFKVNESGEYDFHVQYYDRTGFSTINVNLEETQPFTTNPQPQPTGSPAILSQTSESGRGRLTGSTNFRTYPWKNSSTLIQAMSPGTTFTLLEKVTTNYSTAENRNWYRVRLNDGREGYFWADNVQKVASGISGGGSSSSGSSGSGSGSSGGGFASGSGNPIGGGIANGGGDPGSFPGSGGIANGSGNPGLPQNPPPIFASQWFDTTFSLRNQSFWGGGSNPLFDWGSQYYNPSLINQKNDFFGEHTVKLGWGYAAFLSSGAFDTDLKSSFNIKYPTAAKPGDTVRLDFTSTLQAGNGNGNSLKTRFGAGLKLEGNFQYAYKPTGWTAPLYEIKVGSEGQIDWKKVGDVTNFGISTESNELVGNKISSDGKLDSIAFDIFDLPQFKAGKEAAKAAGIDLGLKIGPVITQQTNLQVNNFLFNLNGVTSSYNYDPNPNDTTTYSYLNIKIPETLKSGDQYNLNLSVMPVADIFTTIGLAAGLSYNVGIEPELPGIGRYKVFSVNNSLTTPSLNFPSISNTNIFGNTGQSYRTIPGLSIKIV